MEIAIFFSVFCVLARSSLGLMDRVTFAHREYPIIKTHFVNTVITFSLALIINIYLTGLHGVINSITSAENFVLAILMHSISMSISFAFKKMNVSDVSVVTKSADIFIPIILILFNAGKFDSSHIFQWCTGLIILPLLLRKQTFRSFIGMSSFFVVISICAQSLVLELFDFKKAIEIQGFAMQVTGILFWRSLLGLTILFFADKKNQKEKIVQISTFDLLKDPFLLSRSILMLINYASFVLAISGDHKGLVWAILNSTGLVSIFLANRFLKEKMGSGEIFAFGLVVATSLIYYVIGGVNVR